MTKRGKKIEPNKTKKEKFVKQITLEVNPKFEIVYILSQLIKQKVSFQHILQILCRFYWDDGYAALSGLPIVTNKESVTALENSLVCLYVRGNWKELVTKAFKFYAQEQKRVDAKKQETINI